MKDEELAAVGIWPRVGHRDEAAPVAAAVECRLLLDLVGEGRAPRTLTAGAVAGRVAALDHEPLQNAVERQAVVVAVLGEQPEILDGFRGICRKEFDLDRALVGLDDPVHPAGARGACGHLRIACGRTAADHPQESDTREKTQPG